MSVRNKYGQMVSKRGKVMAIKWVELPEGDTSAFQDSYNFLRILQVKWQPWWRTSWMERTKSKMCYVLSVMHLPIQCCIWPITHKIQPSGARGIYVSTHLGIWCLTQRQHDMWAWQAIKPVTFCVPSPLPFHCSTAVPYINMYEVPVITSALFFDMGGSTSLQALILYQRSGSFCSKDYTVLDALRVT